MGAESRLRGPIRKALRGAYPRALIVSQPASALTGPGRSDLYVLVSGLYVALEVKIAQGKPTGPQLGWLRDVRRAGGYAFIVRSPAQAVYAVSLALRGAFVAETDAFDINDLFADPGQAKPEERARPEPEPEEVEPDDEEDEEPEHSTGGGPVFVPDVDKLEQADLPEPFIGSDGVALSMRVLGSQFPLDDVIGRLEKLESNLARLVAESWETRRRTRKKTGD